MNKPGIAFVSTSRHKLPDFGPGLALRTGRHARTPAIGSEAATAGWVGVWD
jgi:hypothetical protein